jgi:formylglycine-generating enzyme required for sulfatase activity
MSFARLPRVVFFFGMAALLGSLAVSAHAQGVSVYDWVTVGDPGNAPDTNTGSVYGSVAEPFQIMKYEFTNQQYADFLNSVAATDTYALYSGTMGSDARGGIMRSGVSGSYTYAVKANMGDKPVNYVSWFDAARVANWAQNGATGTSSTETGAYTLNGATSGDAVGVNPGATVFVPTESQWYKAAYYKGGGTNAGYWTYATQSDALPTAVTAGATGDGSAGSTGNFANYNYVASWNGQTGNVTTVGTNGGSSAYGAFDLSGNVLEWDDLNGTPGPTHGLRGGYYGYSTQPPLNLGSTDHYEGAPSLEYPGIGFRLASAVAVPEPSTCAMVLAGLACGGSVVFRRRRAR